MWQCVYRGTETQIKKETSSVCGRIFKCKCKPIYSFSVVVFFSFESFFTALKTENKMGRICKGFLMQTWNKVSNLKAYDFQNKSHIRSYNSFRKFFGGIQTLSLSELGTKEEELRKKVWLAFSSLYSTFYPVSCLFCDWLVANHLACYNPTFSLSRFSI